MKIIKKLFGFVLLFILAAAALIGALGYGKYKLALEKRSIETVVNDLREKKLYTPLSDTPQTFRNAVIAVEDRRFYAHEGIDAIGIVRALVSDFRSKRPVEGGSTITQQLAKNMYFISDNSPSRKIAETLITIELEKAYSKDEILEYYLNIIYFGSGYYGIGEAAEGYCGKKPSDLTDYECTLLAGLPNAPSAYSPKKHPELAEKRRRKVVKAMVREGFLTEEEGEELMQNS